MTDNLPAKPLEPYVMILGCLAVATFLHAWLTLAVVDDAPLELTGISKSENTPAVSAKRTPGQSQYVKSNQFMVKDAICNFVNGDLVCHRAVGIRHISNLTGS